MMNTTDKILTFTAIFISCLALTVSIVQTRIMQKQSKAAVWPRLSNGQGFGPDYYKYTVRNQGVGPAIVTKFELVYKDSAFQNIQELIHYFGKLEYLKTNAPVNLDFSYSHITVGRVISASEVIDVFTANDSISVGIGKKYLSSTDIRVDYCSVYETCWSMQNDEIINLD